MIFKEEKGSTEYLADILKDNLDHDQAESLIEELYFRQVLSEGIDNLIN